MNCPRCGFQNPETTSTCLGCGEVLMAPPYPPVQPPAPQQPMQQQVPPQFPPQGQPYQTGQQPPQYQPYTPYNQTPQFQQTESNEGKGFSIASLVLGIIGITSICWSDYFSLLLAILGLVFGILGLRKAIQSKTMATIGIILNAVTLLLFVIGIVAVAWFYTSLW